MVGNYRSRETTLQLLVYCEERPAILRTYRLEARNRSDGTPDGAVIDDVPATDVNCRVHAQTNDGESEATLDLQDLDVDCTMLQVYVEADGGVAIYHSNHCE